MFAAWILLAAMKVAGLPLHAYELFNTAVAAILGQDNAGEALAARPADVLAGQGLRSFRCRRNLNPQIAQRVSRCYRHTVTI